MRQPQPGCLQFHESVSRDDVSHRFLEAKETKLALFNFPIAFRVVPTNERMVGGRKDPGTWNESFRE